MAVVIETSIGDFTVDLYVKERPKCKCVSFKNILIIIIIIFRIIAIATTNVKVYKEYILLMLLKFNVYWIITILN